MHLGKVTMNYNLEIVMVWGKLREGRKNMYVIVMLDNGKWWGF